MKLIEIKEKTFKLTGTSTTNQLKQKYSDLTTGKDLRRKEEWLTIFERVALWHPRELEISLADLDNSEKMLKESIFNVGRMTGLNEDSLEISWQRIKLESQFTDIHVEEL